MIKRAQHNDLRVVNQAIIRRLKYACVEKRDEVRGKAG